MSASAGKHRTVIMRAAAVSILLTCASVGAVVIVDGVDTLSIGRYCELAEGGLGICKNKKNCVGGDAAQGEKCSSPLVCCPLPGAKAIQKCEEYSKIESINSCPDEDSHAAKLKEFPHMAALGYNNVRNNKWYCGGTLISERYVLSTAVCVTNDRIGPPRRVRLGDLETTDREVIDVQQVTVEEVIVHPNFNTSKKANDIALVKLSKDVKLSSLVRPACLYTATELSAATGVALGWGKTTVGSRADELLKVRVPFVSSEQCQEMYKDKLRGEEIDAAIQICAGDKGKDTCTGDSGGPLQVLKSASNCVAFIVGLTSFGSVPCGGDIPGVYTRVSHFVPWIESVIWP